MREIRSHNAIRGIAALLVMLLHYNLSLVNGSLLPHSLFFRGHLGAMVDLFFVLSGFVMGYVYLEWFSHDVASGERHRFWIARLARIYPLHFLTMLIMMPQLFRDDDFESTDALVKTIDHVLLIHGWGFLEKWGLNTVSWSISGEWAAYLLFPLFCVMLPRRNMRRGLIAMMLISYAILEVAFDGLAFHARLCLLRAIPGFVAGLLLYWYRDVGDLIPGAARDVLALAAVACVVTMLHLGSSSVLYIPLFAVILLMTWRDEGVLAHLLSGRVLHWMGSISYSIYMIHVPISVYFVFLRERLPLGLPSTLDGWPTFFLAIMTTLILGHFSLCLIERPAQRAIRKRFSATRDKLQTHTSPAEEQPAEASPRLSQST